MIKIETLARVGGERLPLAYAYANKNTLRKRVKSLQKDGRRPFVKSVEIANKTIHLIYAREG